MVLTTIFLHLTFDRESNKGGYSAMLHQVKPTFLHPSSRQFPFSEVANEIVHELEKRNWQVPEISVEFRTYGTGHQKFKYVSYVRSRDFIISYSPRAVSEIVIPRRELHVYHDESGPTLYLYVGDDYERDRESFMNGLKIHGKLDGKPKTYLRYKGGCDCQATAGATFEGIGFIMALMDGDADKISKMRHSHQGRRSPLLIHDNDWREYEPEGNEPTHFRTSEVMEDFRVWLTANALKLICSYPEQTAVSDPEPEMTPFPNHHGSFFTYVERVDVERILMGQNNPEKMSPEHRYGLLGNGYRLVSFDVPNDGTIPKIAYDGFLWCAFGKVSPNDNIKKLPKEIGNFSRWDERHNHVVRVTPKFADNVYVADMAPAEAYRHKQFKKTDRLSDEQYCEYQRIKGRSIVPVTEYDGSYKSPVLLVNRELDFDEVEVVISSRLVQI